MNENKIKTLTNITDYDILVVEVKSREFTPTKEISEKGIFIKEEKDNYYRR